MDEGFSSTDRGPRGLALREAGAYRGPAFTARCGPHMRYLLCLVQGTTLLTCSPAVAILLRGQAQEGRRPATGEVIHGNEQVPPLREAVPDS